MKNMNPCYIDQIDLHTRKSVTIDNDQISNIRLHVQCYMDFCALHCFHMSKVFELLQNRYYCQKNNSMYPNFLCRISCLSDLVILMWTMLQLLVFSLCIYLTPFSYRICQITANLFDILKKKIEERLIIILWIFSWDSYKPGLVGLGTAWFKNHGLTDAPPKMLLLIMFAIWKKDIIFLRLSTLFK